MLEAQKKLWMILAERKSILKIAPTIVGKAGRLAETMAKNKKSKRQPGPQSEPEPTQ